MDRAVGVVATAAVVSAVVVWLLWAKRPGMLPPDQPNARSLHVVAKPRSGGIGLWAGVAVACAVFASMTPGNGLGGVLGDAPGFAILAGLSLPIVAVSLADDLSPVSRRWRFVIHMAASAAATAYLQPGPALMWPLVVVGLMWCANLYNFMDGADGYAGGMTVIGFGAYAIAALQAGEAGLGLGSAVVAGAALGFLIWNLPPSRLFMGDVGSVGLGFLAGCIGIAGWLRGAWPMWFPVLVFWVFVTDATATLIWRMARGERFWDAHRSHLYQVFVVAGRSHGALLWRTYPLMLATAGSAIVVRDSVVWLVALAMAGWVAVFAMLWWRVRRGV